MTDLDLQLLTTAVPFDSLHGPLTEADMQAVGPSFSEIEDRLKAAGTNRNRWHQKMVDALERAYQADPFQPLWNLFHNTLALNSRLFLSGTVQEWSRQYRCGGRPVGSGGRMGCLCLCLTVVLLVTGLFLGLLG